MLSKEKATYGGKWINEIHEIYMANLMSQCEAKRKQHMEVNGLMKSMRYIWQILCDHVKQRESNTWR